MKHAIITVWSENEFDEDAPDWVVIELTPALIHRIQTKVFLGSLFYRNAQDAIVSLQSYFSKGTAWVQECHSIADLSDGEAYPFDDYLNGRPDLYGDFALVDDFPLTVGEYDLQLSEAPYVSGASLVVAPIGRTTFRFSAYHRYGGEGYNTPVLALSDLGIDPLPLRYRVQEIGRMIFSLGKHLLASFVPSLPRSGRLTLE